MLTASSGITRVSHSLLPVTGYFYFLVPSFSDFNFFENVEEENEDIWSGFSHSVVTLESVFDHLHFDRIFRLNLVAGKI